MNDFGTPDHTPRLLLIVDLSNFAHTAWWPAISAEQANPALYKATDVLATNLEGKLRTMRNSLEELGLVDYKVVFVEDRQPKAKFAIYPLYKADRVHGDVNPVPIAKDWLVRMGYKTFCHSPDNEADDAIATLAAKAQVPVIIGSSDKDLWRLLNPPRVSIYGLTRNRFITVEDLEEKFKISDPKHLTLVKALWGDSGDGVPNAVPRMQKQLLPLVKEADGDVEVFLQLVKDADLTDRCQELLKLGEAQILANWMLVRLNSNCEIVWERLS